jgi:MFS family permease
MPAYFESARHTSIAVTGRIATIPFFVGALGMIVSGIVADRLIRGGVNPVKTHKTLIVSGLVCSGICTLLVVHAPGTGGATAVISMALFFIYLAGNSAWGLVQSMSPAHVVASVSAIQNCASFLCASIAPLLVGWLLDRTGSFDIALAACAFVAFIGALSYLFIVKDPIKGTAMKIEMQPLPS